MTNNCELCEAHDLETRRLLLELFHPNEMQLLAVITTKAIADQIRHVNNIPMDDESAPNIAALRRDIDYACQMLGKIYIGFGDDLKDKLKKTLTQITGVRIEVTHAQCPHVAAAVVETESASPEHMV